MFSETSHHCRSPVFDDDIEFVNSSHTPSSHPPSSHTPKYSSPKPSIPKPSLPGACGTSTSIESIEFTPPPIAKKNTINQGIL